MDPARLQQNLGLAFRDQALLRLALTHPSYLNEHPEEPGGSNQRLEFLGDALIGLVVARVLYRRYPGLDEGQLTDLRSQVVNGQALAEAARRWSLGQWLLLGQGEAATGGRDRDSNLAAAMEALVGAVLLDRGYRAAQSLVFTALDLDLARVGTGSASSKDPKSQLQETVQRLGKEVPRYELVGQEGPPHHRIFKVQVVVDGQVLGTGEGGRKIEAERQAALHGLKQME